jgi:hypothetical protein
MHYQQFVSHAYCGATGPVSKIASRHKKAFCMLLFEVSRSVITLQREFRGRFRTAGSTVITDLVTSKRSTQKAFSCCDTILETGPTVSMRSELLVAHKKLGQLPLYLVPV